MPPRGGTIIEPTKFDQLFANAAPLISSGNHLRDSPPVEGGRWPVSVVLRPPADGHLSHRLDVLTAEAATLAGPGHWQTNHPLDVPTAEAATLAGPGHWQTGQLGSAHLTVRALETYRPYVDPAEPVIQRYRSAMERAAAQSGPARVQVTGLTLTPGTVMACAVPLDPQADNFLDQFAMELGPDGWYEHPDRRDIWYLNLLHFTADIPSPEPLITWVKSHRSIPLGETTVDTAELVRFHHAPAGPRPLMRPHVIASAPLGSWRS